MILYLFLTIVITGIIACESKSAPVASETDSDSVHIVVGFSQIGDESEWRTANTASIQNEAKRLK